ncbi:MAG: DnaD domain protein [Oscillospiraceae bacterium]|nr:DnaD domain protein [Oscillospiraceae bacterium]
MRDVTLTTEELRKLLSCGCSDATALHLYCKSGAPRETALDALHFTSAQMIAATNCLRRLGLWQEQVQAHIRPAPPEYSYEDVQREIKNSSFSKLIGEAQRRFGRTLSTEELKTLLSMTDYLRLPNEVIGLLLSYCIERSRMANGRMPSMRTVEKEAYHWADAGIVTLEEASFYAQSRQRLHTRVQALQRRLQITQRRLTAAEERYIHSWMEMGFGDDVIFLAYERTCEKTGGLKWAYMNGILKSWNEKGLHSVQEVEAENKPAVAVGRRGNDACQRHNAEVSPLSRQAVARILSEEG